MKCPKTWCDERHYGCERFKKKDPIYGCHRKENPPFQKSIDSKELRRSGDE